jgi:hypothetical protein
MNANKITATTEDTKALLSTLWIVVMFALLAADVLSSYIPGPVRKWQNSQEKHQSPN